MKIRLDNQYTQYVTNKEYSAEANHSTEMKNLAILYTRLGSNVADVLLPNIYNMDDKDSEIKRMINML